MRRARGAGADPARGRAASDIDLTLVAKDPGRPGATARLEDRAAELMAALHETASAAGMQQVVNVAGARVPVVRFVAPDQTARAKDGGEGLDVDVVLNNQGGVRKSLFTRRFWAVDARFAELTCAASRVLWAPPRAPLADPQGVCLFSDLRRYLVKEWGRQSGLQAVLIKTVNSWSLTLMVIHHLQRCAPPLMPPLQSLLDHELDEAGGDADRCLL